MKFELTKEELEKIDAWSKEQDKIVLEKQIKSKIYDSNPFVKQLLDSGEPYYGAIGGCFSYVFTPTSLGVAKTVIHSFTKAELDITDYDSW